MRSANERAPRKHVSRSRQLELIYNVIAIPEPHGTEQELYLVHDIDSLPRVFAASALLEGL
jgi:hypothetical protein